MRLHDTEFGKIFRASGGGGFKCDGTEYWQHSESTPRLLRPDFTGISDVTKTITLHERTIEDGANMELDRHLRPTERFPKSIAFNPITKAVVNAVGLTNPGAEAFFEMLVKQNRTRPFTISFMSVAGTAKERLAELAAFVEIFQRYLPLINTQVALQINFSCPNAGLNPNDLLGEVEMGLNIASTLGMPLVPKFSVDQLTVESGLEIGKHPHCAAICLSNTIPWAKLPTWEKIKSFGSTKSPIFGRRLSNGKVIQQEGGYSGPYLFPLVLDWVHQARKRGLSTPINAGGGIFTRKNIRQLCDAGADSVFIGSVAMLRPWHVQGLIQYANNLTWRT